MADVCWQSAINISGQLINKSHPPWMCVCNGPAYTRDFEQMRFPHVHTRTYRSSSILKPAYAGLALRTKTLWKAWCSPAATQHHSVSFAKMETSMTDFNHNKIKIRISCANWPALTLWGWSVLFCWKWWVQHSPLQLIGLGLKHILNSLFMSTK